MSFVQAQVVALFTPNYFRLLISLGSVFRFANPNHDLFIVLIVQGRDLASSRKKQSLIVAAKEWLVATVVMSLLLPFYMIAKALVFKKIRATLTMGTAISGGGSLPPHVDKFFQVCGSLSSLFPWGWNFFLEAQKVALQSNSLHSNELMISADGRYSSPERLRLNRNLTSPFMPIAF